MISLPSHWLLLFGFAGVVANAGALAAYGGWHRAVRAPYPTAPPLWIPLEQAWAPSIPGILHQMVGWGLASLAAQGIARASFRRLGWSWSGLFFLAAVGSGTLSAMFRLALLEHVRRTGITWCDPVPHHAAKLDVAGLILLGFAATLDVARGMRDDSLHGLGVAGWGIFHLMQLTTYFRILFASASLSQTVRLLVTC